MARGAAAEGVFVEGQVVANSTNALPGISAQTITVAGAASPLLPRMLSIASRIVDSVPVPPAYVPQ